MKIKTDGDAQTEIERVRKHSPSGAQLLRGRDQSSEEAKRLEEDTIELGFAREIARSAAERADRVAELKQLVNSGKYNPDSRAVAGSIDSAISEEVIFEKIENA